MTEQKPSRISPKKLADRLIEAQQRRFVGREHEKALFTKLLQNPEPEYLLLHIHGPGGVGKTSLVNELATIARAQNILAIQLDGRNIDPSPGGFLFGIKLLLGLDEHSSVFDTFAKAPKIVIFIDTYETLTPLDSWLREVFLPQLPDLSLVVLAGRNSPSESWLADAGWHDLVKTISLRNLFPEESRNYLAKRGIAAHHHQSVLEFTHGHPLALSLVADVFSHYDGDLHFSSKTSPDIVKSLLDRFLKQVPSPKHREALEVAALVRTTQEALLKEALGLDDVHDYFEWLRGLSFIEAGTSGLFPHDLARESLDADLRWRNPDLYKELHAKVRGYYNRKLQETSGLEQQRILFEDVYLHRHNPMVKPFLDWGKYGSVFGERASNRDLPVLREIVKNHEGEAALIWFDFWAERQPQGITVYRGINSEPTGFLMAVNLRLASQEDIALDPASCASWNYAMRYAPPRSQENVLLFRFWMAKDEYQGVSATQSIIFLNVVQQYFATPNLAWSFFPCADAEFWLPALHYMDINRAPEADFGSEQPFANFAHDWRALDVAAWLELLGQRELNTELKPEDLVTDRPEPLLVLSEPDFKQAAKEALKDYTRSVILGSNPLIHSRTIKEHTDDDPVEALRNLLKQGAELLRQNPRDEKAYRALLRTYLEPAATQELAAELLDLPFSTYRRHLTTGVEKVADWLWQHELQT
ncbi:MAG: AAA family ATPase [Trueperaceae bacterium]|nr:AAA family ATPase [Trueperaceae bacterium]